MISFYDKLYSKESLNIYMYMFERKYLDSLKQIVLIDLISATFLYVSYQNNQDVIKNWQNLWLNLSSYEDIDKLFQNDNKLNYLYSFYIIRPGFRVSYINKYNELFFFLKDLISKINVDELNNFIKLKNEIEFIFDQLKNNKLNYKENTQFKNEVEQKLLFLEKYISQSKIDSYRTYFDVHTGNVENFALVMGINLFDKNRNDISFSNLYQIELLKERAAQANYLSHSDLKKINLNKKYRRKLKEYFAKKLIFIVGILLVLIIFFAPASINTYQNYMNTGTNDLLLLLAFFALMWLIFLFNILKYILYLFLPVSMINGEVGVISDISWSYSGNNSHKNYQIYFLKQNKKININSKRCYPSILKRKSMVYYLEFLNQKMVLEISDKDLVNYIK